MPGTRRERGLALIPAAFAVLLGAACASPAAAPSGDATRTPGQAASRYLAIAQAGNRRLEIDFNRLEGPDRGRLMAARADLADAAATERLFDHRLLMISFDPTTEPIARLLYRLNQTRASATAAAARSRTLPELRRWQRRLTQENAAVEGAVRVIRSQLGLPPPSTS